ncbi:ABC transporter permease subunit [Acetobacter sp. TBRC 12305]|uniref:ABC transporter permease subunit n=1 Tax=Acetobacter garciniae TaxID=2817435 RepID=A0A939HIK6_9PROT|nr:ABC transporter permease subunit [Acetobacter garciniae]MBO1325093.1 ABC transporter permease subunit [Acetobacter garciniae]MBX0344936.1 ABC transporter permease subunit [Acetobacter garciniae]
MVLYSAVGISAFLTLVPIFLVLVQAFSAGEMLTFPLPGLSVKWFVRAYTVPEIRESFLFSVILAVVSSVFSVMLALCGALYVSRNGGVLSRLVTILALVPLVFPAFILGLALLFFFKAGGVNAKLGLLIAHIVISIPYAFRPLVEALKETPLSLEEAAQSLGAGPLSSFVLVTFPQIAAGVGTAWVFCFVVSFSELSATLFLAGPGAMTLPVELFSYLEFQGDQLVVAAASTAQVLLTLGMVFLGNRVFRRR